MKFNFKKVTSVLAGTLMLGATLGTAMAAYPVDFTNDVDGTAIVVGSGAADSCNHPWTQSYQALF